MEQSVTMSTRGALILDFVLSGLQDLRRDVKAAALTENSDHNPIKFSICNSGKL